MRERNGHQEWVYGTNKKPLLTGIKYNLSLTLPARVDEKRGIHVIFIKLLVGFTTLKIVYVIEVNY